MSYPSDADVFAAAHHEASHACVSDHLLAGSPGFSPARIELWRAGRNGATWVRGRCFHATPQTADQLQLICLAGAIGEVLSGPCASNTGDALLNVTLPCISASDAAGAGNFTRADLDRCIGLVRTLWPLIKARAAKEIEIFNRDAGVAASMACNPYA